MMWRRNFERDGPPLCILSGYQSGDVNIATFATLPQYFYLFFLICEDWTSTRPSASVEPTARSSSHLWTFQLFTVTTTSVVGRDVPPIATLLAHIHLSGSSSSVIPEQGAVTRGVDKGTNSQPRVISSVGSVRGVFTALTIFTFSVPFLGLC